MSGGKVMVQISPKLAYILDSLAAADHGSIERAIWRLLDHYGDDISGTGYASKLKTDLGDGATTWLS